MSAANPDLSTPVTWSSHAAQTDSRVACKMTSSSGNADTRTTSSQNTQPNKQMHRLRPTTGKVVPYAGIVVA